MRNWLLFLISFFLLNSCKTTAELDFFRTKPASEPSARHCSPESDFRTAMQHFDLEFALALAKTEADRSYVAWAQMLIEGSPGYRMDLLPKGDTASYRKVLVLLQALAWLEGDYSNMLAWAKQASPTDQDAIHLASAYANLPRAMQMTLPESSLELPLALNGEQKPQIEVQVNGRTYRFWIDTGAAVNVLSSKVAQACQVELVDGPAVEIGTSTRHKVTGQLASVEQFQMGTLNLAQVPFMVMDHKALSLRLLGISIFKIDGIIGWPILKDMDLEINIPEAKLLVRRPKDRPDVATNLFWYWQPVLQVKSTTGCLLNLKLDTGSATTFFYPSAYPKLGRTVERHSQLLVGGVGGKEMIRIDQLSDCRFWLGEEEVNLSYAEGRDAPEDEDAEFVFDGVIGQDILSQGNLRLDFQNRHYDFQFAPSEAQE